MRQSVLRLLAAALVAVLSASLLIGTAFAEGPVPDQPPGPDRGAPHYTKDNPLTLPVQHEVSEPYPKTIDIGDGVFADSNETCRHVVHIASHQGKTLRAGIEWCWLNDAYEISGNPDLSVSANYSSDWRVDTKRHRKTRGGDGADRVYTNSYGRFCHNDLPDICSRDVIEIDAKHWPTGPYSAKAKYYVE